MNILKGVRAKKVVLLRWYERSFIFLLGCGLIAAAIFVLVVPPKRVKTEVSTEGTAEKRTVEDSDPTNVAIVSFISGLVVLAVAINGTRIGRLAFGPIRAENEYQETEAVEKTIQNYSADVLKSAIEDRPEVPLQEVPPDQEVTPTMEPTQTVTSAAGNLPVYRLEAIPVRVLLDLFTEWPEAGPPLPRDLSSFEFALRKSGKGNHPWIIKFKGSAPMVISYGRGGSNVKPLAREIPSDSGAA